MINWYRKLLARTRIGTTLATLHVCFMLVLLGSLSISPGRDWAWWPLAPTVLDFPASIPINAFSVLCTLIFSVTPHQGLDTWLMTRRDPFSSVNLFWFPAINFLVFGTLWHYYWPQAVRFIFRALKSKKSNQA
jgi:hypothetical protein